ncbi:metal dependent phosphohydrolase [Thermosinus carboxydivorans Nor1]|uniref:Metal dependent phosphohydrolase n=1 Tax=Thermosinus carboxydivorans Nor1 TaxID=401526 RepID=A1HRP8_9FIRM|nr:HD domain-containing phosphohydrolase [Thermosinus carboxydivorans]EAX47368.1 metal dependent phosphohydrolase [Thermosinus carboxydivorans Nor1]
MQFNIHPVNLIRALSLALELSAGGLSRHHWRTAYIANCLAEHIGLDGMQRLILVYATLLHDLGAASSWEERLRLPSMLTGAGGNIYAHAEAGYELLKDSVQLGMVAEPIRRHHDYWDGSSPSGLAGEDIPLISRIINLADRVEVLLHEDDFILNQRPAVLAAISSQSGSCFDPELVRAFHDFSSKESFWFDLVNRNHYQNFFRDIDDYGRMRFTIDDVINVAEVFATIIDRTSRFTGAHSRCVALVASFLAELKGYSADEVKAMRIAGLFHDLGKLAIPNAILEKRGKLSELEFAIIKQHTYYTYRILEQIDGFATIAEWAAYHHETLDGTGYPFRIDGKKLGLGSRIMAVADVFTALSEIRPYREPLPYQKVESIMRGMVNSRKLDAKITAELFDNGRQLYDLIQSMSSAYKP